jgi:hypothetical protein
MGRIWLDADDTDPTPPHGIERPTLDEDEQAWLDRPRGVVTIHFPYRRFYRRPSRG